MKKKKLLLVTSSILMTLSLVACGGGNTSSAGNSTSSEKGTSEQLSSSFEYVHTEALTNEMLQGLNNGYSAEVFTTTDYEGGSSSRRIREIKSNEFNSDVKIYSVTNDSPTTKNGLVSDSHYQPKPGEEKQMLYNAGLSVGNSVIYTPVLGEDPRTYEEIELTWEEGFYGNAFQTVKAEHFTRVGDENEFTLDINNATLEYDGTYSKIMWQLFGENAGSDLESFVLKTNGSDIIGFELSYETYSSGESIVKKSSWGNILATGSDVTDFITPLEGQEDANFKAAIDKLKAQNYEMTQSQQRYNFDQNRFLPDGSFAAAVEDGKKLSYDIFYANGAKYKSCGYYEIEEDGERYKQGVVKIGDDFYPDYIYAGTMEELLPSFELSSLCFTKDEAASTDAKEVWNLREDLRFSTGNNISVFTPFDTDSYWDYIIYLTVTISEDSINIHNETSHSGNGGLIVDTTFTNFGGVKDLIPANKIHNSIDGLTWTQLLSNDETGIKSLIKTFTADVLDAIPTLDFELADFYVDSNVIFFFVYDLEEANTLLANYAEKLLANGYAKGVGDELYQKVVTIDGRQYMLNISLAIWWNSILEYGQFQMALSLSSVK